MKSDRVRQERVAFNAARLKEKEDEEIRRQHLVILPSELDPTPSETAPESTAPQAPPSKPIGLAPEPQSWVPLARRR